MHFLIGLGLAVVLLWAWLIGHWFARVLVFLLLAAFSLVIDHISPSSSDGQFAVIGCVIAWFVSGIPIYCLRYRARLGQRPGRHWRPI